MQIKSDTLFCIFLHFAILQLMHQMVSNLYMSVVVSVFRSQISAHFLTLEQNNPASNSYYTITLLKLTNILLLVIVWKYSYSNYQQSNVKTIEEIDVDQRDRIRCSDGYLFEFPELAIALAVYLCILDKPYNRNEYCTFSFELLFLKVKLCTISKS